jgi:glycopeptide antibiotics resistance protein
MSGPMMAIPLLLPALLVAIVVAVLAARPLARPLGVNTHVVFLLVCGFGLVLAATITPTDDAIFDGQHSSGICDLSRFGIAPIPDLVRPTEASLNVLLFVPLGIAVGLLPRSRHRMIVAALAVLLTFLVEGTQLLVPALGRGCQSADIVDNLLGLVIGASIGIVLRQATEGHDEGVSGP